ncbi:hypothetical protein EMIHUDRAFT_66718 [Emiliania huxleyi CCMP1516]|uniref:Ferredoxin n=2 Tax=Emiliania huxleyi TaxID=2903 RepID=A0A0D3IRB2_EMIH1|nr:hypothetical protein EMIHUDRAFT_66718 [Emiliania huxleyi CCMP1516]EOD13797.1 hypothetical protein EMIHUDRAFT_66718 [Emiliania huxleyi CCMP1516]|eukprot:XP_005766226.1 hypothetical protein EMIHUDRAFT_66718 [Emiliania huxleyi CCMP1516]
MAESFSVTFVAPDGSERVLGVPDDEYILDRAEEKGIELPYSCRAGACCECIGKVIEGDVDNSDAAFLDEDQLEEGWRLLCTAYATTDAKVLTHQKEEFLGL